MYAVFELSNFINHLSGHQPEITYIFFCQFLYDFGCCISTSVINNNPFYLIVFNLFLKVDQVLKKNSKSAFLVKNRSYDTKCLHRMFEKQSKVNFFYVETNQKSIFLKEL